MDVKPQPAPSVPLAGHDTAEQGPVQAGQSGLVALVIKVLLVVLLVRSFVIAPFSIPSESMLPKLWIGDTLIAHKWAYGYSRYSLPFNAPLIPGRVFASQPERGDIVIFKHPIDQQDYIKRVIGLSGDTVAVVDGKIVLNGEPVGQEPLADFHMPLSANASCSGGRPVLAPDQTWLCRFTRFRETLPGGVQYDVLESGLSMGDTYTSVDVPEGHLFVMGDHRDRSIDSRFAPEAGLGIGMVPQTNLVGRASVIVWSSDGSGEWYKPWTWFSAARTDRIGTGL